MNRPTPLRPKSVPPLGEASINDNLPTSSPSPRATLIGAGCIVGIIALAVLYGTTIGF
jgi:hypothetical protein